MAIIAKNTIVGNEKPKTQKTTATDVVKGKVIAKNIIILGEKETVLTLKNNTPVNIRVSRSPVVRVVGDQAIIDEIPDVAVAEHPDYVHKPSDYVAHMFNINK